MLSRIAQWLRRRAAPPGEPSSPTPPAASEPPVADVAVVPVVQATPRRRRRRREPGALPPELHAQRLLHWCQTSGDTGEILAADLAEIYLHQCAWDLVEPLPWQAVAVELRRLLGGRKDYRWVERDGTRHRLRVYRIPPPPRGDSTFLELGAWLAREMAQEPVQLRRAA